MHFVGLLALARPPRPPCMSVATVARLSADTETCPCGGEDVARYQFWGLSFRLHSLLSKTLLSGSVRPGTHGVNGKTAYRAIPFRQRSRP